MYVFIIDMPMNPISFIGFIHYFIKFGGEMSTLLRNRAIITYDNKIIESCEVVTNIKSHKMVVHKRSITSNVDVIEENPISKFKDNEIIPIEIQLINYEKQAATGIVVRNDIGGNEVRAVKIVDQIPKGLRFIDNTGMILRDGKAYRLNNIDDINQYENGDYSYIINDNTITVLIPRVDAQSDVVITFKVENDDSIAQGESVNNEAEVDYNENPHTDEDGNHIPEKSELITISNSTTDIVVKKDAPEEVTNKEIFSYSITVENQGAESQSGLSVMDKLPEGFSLIENAISVNKGNLLLVDKIDYTSSIENGVLIISGTNDEGLSLNSGEILVIKINGYMNV